MIIMVISYLNSYHLPILFSKTVGASARASALGHDRASGHPSNLTPQPK